MRKQKKNHRCPFISSPPFHTLLISQRYNFTEFYRLHSLYEKIFLIIKQTNKKKTRLLLKAQVRRTKEREERKRKRNKDQMMLSRYRVHVLFMLFGLSLFVCFLRQPQYQWTSENTTVVGMYVWERAHTLTSHKGETLECYTRRCKSSYGPSPA